MRRTPHDREILFIALPSLGALAAEPLYLLTDTAIVGHLGTTQLGALSAASAVLLTGYSICIFLAYGTTAAVARLVGAGEHRRAAHEAVQGVWLALLLGVVLAAPLGQLQIAVDRPAAVEGCAQLLDHLVLALAAGAEAARSAAATADERDQEHGQEHIHAQHEDGEAQHLAARQPDQRQQRRQRDHGAEAGIDEHKQAVQRLLGSEVGAGIHHARRVGRGWRDSGARRG